MKKKLLILGSVLTLAIYSASAATPPDVPALVQNELQREFKGASDVKWKATDRFYKASFSVNGQNLQAFFATDGEFIGVSRNITFEQLPLAISTEAFEKSKDNKLTDLFEISSDRGTEYYMSLQNAKGKTNVYKSGGESWSRY